VRHHLNRDAFDEERAQLLMRNEQLLLEVENLRVRLSEVDVEKTVLKEEMDCMDKDLREAHHRIDEMEHSLNSEIEENEDLGHRYMYDPMPNRSISQSTHSLSNHH